MSDDKRLEPEAFLDLVPQAQRGRLKIYIGAAAGVGKSYRMLEEAHQLRDRGVDVVLGFIETHHRRETEERIGSLEIVPRRKIQYGEVELEEMDVDSIIARKPDVVLVDELAHTNAPGSRHPKRYQDVEELLAAGIHVYSTLNIQHIESLNDVVARTTRARARETGPAHTFDTADDVEVIVPPPDELIQRRQEGKVYAEQQAQRAL